MKRCNWCMPSIWYDNAGILQGDKLRFRAAMQRAYVANEMTGLAWEAWQTLQQTLEHDLVEMLQLEGLVAQADHHWRMPSRQQHLAEKAKVLHSASTHQRE